MVREPWYQSGRIFQKIWKQPGANPDKIEEIFKKARVCSPDRNSVSVLSQVRSLDKCWFGVLVWCHLLQILVSYTVRVWFFSMQFFTFLMLHFFVCFFRFYFILFNCWDHCWMLTSDLSSFPILVSPIQQMAHLLNFSSPIEHSHILLWVAMAHPLSSMMIPIVTICF